MNKLEKLFKSGKNKQVLKNYKNGVLYLESNISWVDNIEYYYLSFKDNNDNIYLFNKKINYNTFKNIYSYYNIYNGASFFVKSSYIKKTIDKIENYNKGLRNEK